MSPQLIRRVFLFLFLSLVAFYSLNALSESDSFYHLKTGELIWQTKSIPHADVFSYTAQGAPWVTHEWLAELVFYGVYYMAGFWGLMVFVALCASLTYYFLFRIAEGRGAHFGLSLALLFGLGFLTFELWIPRPQVFSYLFTALLIWLLELHRKEGRRSYLFGVLGMIWMWANMHASFPLGILIFFLYVISVSGVFSSSTARSLKELWGIGVGMVILSFFNPHGAQAFIYGLLIRPAVATLGVEEWRPITDFLNRPESLIFLLKMAVGSGFALWWFLAKKERRDIWLAGLVLGVSLMPFISIRYVGYWVLGAVVPFIIALSRFWRVPLEKHQGESMLRILALGWVLLFVAHLFSVPRSYFNKDTVPVYAADFVEEAELKGPMFHLYNEGGYLLWRLWPREKVFIDGRSEVYGGEPLSDLFTIVHDGEGWKNLVDTKYRINYFFLAYRSSRIQESVMPLFARLTREGWPLVHWDDTTLIFVRPTEENRGVIEKYALRHISPLRPPELIPENEAQAALEEIRWMFQRSHSSSIIGDYAGRFVISHPNTGL